MSCSPLLGDTSFYCTVLVTLLVSQKQLKIGWLGNVLLTEWSWLFQWFGLIVFELLWVSVFYVSPYSCKLIVLYGYMCADNSVEE